MSRSLGPGSRVLFAFLVAAVGGCGGGGNDGTSPRSPSDQETAQPTVFRRGHGDAQRWTVADVLPESLEVEVLDQHLRPLTGVPVTFAAKKARGPLPRLAS